MMLILFLLVASARAQLLLSHRIFHPQLPISPFTPRAAITIDPSPALVPDPTLSQDLASFVRQAAPFPDALYQVALHVDGNDLSISSVKACHLSLSESDYLTLHLSSTGIPYSLDYFLHPVPHDGSCSKRSQTTPLMANTTIFLRSPSSPPLPELRAPPPLTPQGEQITPIPEKTFLQKYWIYILLALVGLAMSGGGPEEEPAAGGAQ